jgi:hypothetical protein
VSPSDIHRKSGGAIISEKPVDLSDRAVLISLAVAALFGGYLLLTSTTDPLPFIYWRYDAKRILQFGLLFLLFLAPAVNGRIRLEFGHSLATIPVWMKITLLCVFTWGTLSVLVNARSPMQGLNSFSEVALLSALVLGVFVIAACRRTAGRPFDRIAIGLIALTGLTVGIQELIGVIAAQNAGVDFNFRISLLHFSWPRFYNQVQSWTVPALIALPMLFSRYRLVPVLCAVVLGLHWYVMIMGGARGSVVSLIAASAFAVVFFPSIRGRLLRWQMTGLVLGLLIYSVVLYSFESERGDPNPAPANTGIESPRTHQPGAETRDSDSAGGASSFLKQSLGKSMTSSAGRIGWWLATLEDTRDNPMLGIGPMNYVCTSPRWFGHPHNFPLQLAAEWGAPIALTVSVIFLYLLVSVSRDVRRRRFRIPGDNLYAGLLLTGILAAACHACLSGVMVMPASQVTGVLICGILAGLYPGHSGKTAPARWQSAYIPGLVLCMFLLILGSHELKTMQQREPLLSPGEAMWPRIWQDSKVCSLYTLPNEVKK